MNSLSGRQYLWRIGGELGTGRIRGDTEVNDVPAGARSQEQVGETGALTIFAAGVAAEVKNALPLVAAIPDEPRFEGDVTETGDDSVRQVHVSTCAEQIQFS